MSTDLSPAVLTDEIRHLYRPQSGLPVLFAPVLLVLAYGHVLFLPYGVMDDFTLLEQPDLLLRVHVLNTRPVYGALSWLAFLFVPSDVGWLFVYRIASVLGLMALAALIAWWLRRLQWSPPLSAFAGLMVGCLAPMQVYASWATMWGAPVAFCLSAAALLIVFHGNSDGPPPKSTQTWMRSAAALVLVILALATYQPGGAVYFALLIPAVWGSSTNWLSRKRVVVRAVGLGVTAMFAYALFAFVFQRYFGALGGRALAIPDPVEKLSWFALTVVPRAAELWRVGPGAVVGPVIALVLAIGYGVEVFSNRRTSQPRVTPLLSQVMMVLVLLALSYAANLMVAENFPSSRSQGALTTGICLLFVAAVRSIGLRLEAPRTLHAVSLVLVAVALILAAKNTLLYCAVPQSIEWRMLKQELRKGREEILRTGRVHVIRPASAQGASSVVQGDEFGLPSLFSPRVPEPMVGAALRTMGAEFAPTRVTHSAYDEAVPADGRPVIDMRRLAAWTAGTDAAALVLTEQESEAALKAAAVSGDTDTVKALLDKGTKVDARDENGGTALGHAVWFGRLETVRLLIDRGADVNVKKQDGMTPLQLAIASNHPEVAEVLKKAGAR